jgi:hypothetical protein
MGNLAVYIDVSKKAFDRLEDVNGCIVTGSYALGRLIRMDVIRIGT